jgi:hypothetical protein
MKTKKQLITVFTSIFTLAAAFNSSAQFNVPSTFHRITIDGSLADWGGVPLAYTAPPGPTNGIQYKDIYIANDENYLYIRFSLYAPGNPFLFINNLYIDADNSTATGLIEGSSPSIGSDMLIESGVGYQQLSGVFNAGGIDNLGWAAAGTGDSMNYEVRVSRAATYNVGGGTVFNNATIAILFDAASSGYAHLEWFPDDATGGGFIYTFAPVPQPLTTNLSLLTMTNTAWAANDSGSDLATAWLDSAYDDTQAGWTSGQGLLGYTPNPGAYPVAIHKSLASGPNTYYFRSHFQWTNDSLNAVLVVTNYLSDGAVYYLNGYEVKRVRMPAGPITYVTAASATNTPAGSADVFGISSAGLVNGDNIVEVEAHQAPGSSADLVFGLSLTAAISYPIFVEDTTLPADQSVLAGQPVTFLSGIIGSGPISYQWYFNGTSAISGATNASLAIPLVLTNNAGHYSLFASNSDGTATTRSALLTVSSTTVTITNPPANQVAEEGRPATFSVGVSGTPLISYQWKYGVNQIAGATNATYTIAASSQTNAGSYSVSVSNPGGSASSSAASLTVLHDTIPPSVSAIATGGNTIVVNFDEFVSAATAGDFTKYSLNGGVSVIAAVPNTNDASQVTLTTSASLAFGTVYTLSINGVTDLFGNPAHTSASFVRGITIDGSFDDWAGVSPIYTTGAPSASGGADFKEIYALNDANYYYFRVVLWGDIPPASGQFPYYANLYFDTDNDPTTGLLTVGSPGLGYSAIGSEMLCQSGASYQEKNGNFNDGFGIVGLDWLCLPAAPGTNFEFRLSRAATFADGTNVFGTNVINFIFQGVAPSYVAVTQAPPGGSGTLSYTNISSASAPALKPGNLAIYALGQNQTALVWEDPSATLQTSSALAGASWTNLPSAASPYVISSATGLRFFRLAH